MKGSNMTRSIRELADRFYEIVNGADGEFAEIFSPDFVFGIMPGFPYGGDWHGLDETNEFFEKLGAHFEFWEVHTDRFLAVDDENLVVTGKYKTKSSETGKDVLMDTVHLWTAKGGMMTSYKHYCDTAILAAAMDFKVPTR
jgi:ketosteroid isomerase-like protein